LLLKKNKDLSVFVVRLLQDIQRQCEEEIRAREEARESYNMAERRCTVLSGEVEELRNALESVRSILHNIIPTTYMHGHAYE
jgi:predicted translin family RNA/ssDNA-binding protein